ncbi:hypothetical protein DY000_02058578 [Brassica cretica]|uniref:Zinc finger GRF-type domain-containing protein n=1 Tax=Brassica cretica TaxID=69181 RepID=A0ABQ7B381_BRACR|nr:hypothetical protein DY000_02058578 [Brassica cretica]
MMSSGCEDSSVNTMGIRGIRGIPEKWDCGRSTGIYTSKSRQNPGRTFFRCPTFRNLKEDVRKASNELKKLNVIMKVGFLIVCLSIVICLVLIMLDKANGLSLKSY